MWYPEFISLSCCRVKSYKTPEIFLIYEGDPLSPPEGEAAQGVRPLDPRDPLVKNNVFKQHSCPARPRQGGRATPEGVGLLILLNIFVK